MSQLIAALDCLLTETEAVDWPGQVRCLNQWRRAPQQPEAIPNDHEGGPHIGGNRHPEGGHACRCQPDEEQFHPQGKDNVLLDHGQRAPCMAYEPGEFQQIIRHQRDIGGLDRGI